jgi:tRNA pseudouridine38-40 synthase
MDIYYKNINFQYDDYALERFKRVLEDNLMEYKRKCSTSNNILFSFINRKS